MNYKRLDGLPALWRVLGLTPYEQVMADMAQAHSQLVAGTGREQVWLLQSPPGYSRGAHSDKNDDERAKQLRVEGGAPHQHLGGYWYHGPGVVGVVLLLDFRARRRSVLDINAVVHEWFAASLRQLGLSVADVRTDQPGVWVGGRKVAAVVLGLRQWCTSYGGAINLDPDMAAFSKIKPCRGEACSVTSLAAEGVPATYEQVAVAMRDQFHQLFGWTSDAP